MCVSERQRDRQTQSETDSTGDTQNGRDRVMPQIWFCTNPLMFYSNFYAALAHILYCAQASYLLCKTYFAQMTPASAKYFFLQLWFCCVCVYSLVKSFSSRLRNLECSHAIRLLNIRPEWGVVPIRYMKLFTNLSSSQNITPKKLDKEPVCSGATFDYFSAWLLLFHTTSMGLMAVPYKMQLKWSEITCYLHPTLNAGCF